jgi:DNA repair ATPase RecN
LCERFFSLPANIVEQQHEAPATLTKLLSDAIALQQTHAINEVGQRNANYFETELDKLDNWGEDRRNSLKVVLKELDQQIKEVKKQARLAPNLPDKLKLEKERKKLEAERDTAWKEYDWAAKEIEQNKDQLIDKVEKRLKQNLKDEQLFNFKWTLI